jgi:hypothetical protein
MTQKSKIANQEITTEGNRNVSMRGMEGINEMSTVSFSITYIWSSINTISTIPEKTIIPFISDSIVPLVGNGKFAVDSNIPKLWNKEIISDSMIPKLWNDEIISDSNVSKLWNHRIRDDSDIPKLWNHRINSEPNVPNLWNDRFRDNDQIDNIHFKKYFSINIIKLNNKN